MLELLFALLGFFLPNQNANTISQDQHPVVQTSSDSIDGDTNGEKGDVPVKNKSSTDRVIYPFFV
ncbi:MULTISPECIES: hypothetical protein [Empedobacter]|uniref:hypothetical protein n=1 Tax=Empedobacter TaxID=59734 RepID=UPI0025B7BDF9|nr:MULTISPECIES: hypothetical protein [unclassified Empedobacter]